MENATWTVTAAVIAVVVSAAPSAAAERSALEPPGVTRPDSPVVERVAGLGVGGPGGPELRWGRCPAGWEMRPRWQCAVFAVPRDYSRPTAGTVELAMARLPAGTGLAAGDRARQRAGKKRGSVFFNPGGPGGDGLEAAVIWEKYVGAAVRAKYDLVTWAPRGVEPSTTLRCQTARQVRDAFKPRAVLNYPELRANLTGGRRTAADCARKPLTPYVTTADNVRDLDRMRRAVGDAKLSYVGISYGTVIGAYYANMFPARYRAMVLHGVVDSTTWSKPTFDFVKDDAVQLEKTLDAALDACESKPRACAFAPEAQVKHDELLRETRRRATKSGDSRLYTGLAVLSRELLGVSRRSPARAARELQKSYNELIKARPATSATLLAAAKRPIRPLPRGTVDFSNVRDATICSDAGRMPRTNAAWINASRAADRLAPTFGTESVLDRSACARWSAFGDRYAGPWGKGKQRIFIVNQRWDHATPLKWAETMAGRLGRTRLLTINGFGHGQETPCSRKSTDRYLLTTKFAGTGTRCDDGWPLF